MAVLKKFMTRAEEAERVLRRVVALVMAASLAFVEPLPAQFIGGHVIDSYSGRSLGGISVVATRERKDVSTTSTDSSGNFYLGPLRPGVYRLRIADGTAAPFLSD